MKDEVYKNQAVIADEWLKFINYDIKPQKVRPIISESWQRCKDYGLCAWDFPGLGVTATFSEHNRKLQENKWLMDFTLPVLHYLCGILDNVNFKLKDTSNYILYSDSCINNCGLYIESSGLLSAENLTGTIPGNLALLNNAPVEVMGCEHFFVRYHHYYGAASLIENASGEVGGVVDLWSTGYSQNYELAKQCLRYVSTIVSSCVKKGDCRFETSEEFTEILDRSPDPVICVNHKGTVLNMNQKAVDRWNYDFAGTCITDLIGVNDWKSIRFNPGRARQLELFDSINQQYSNVILSRIYKFHEGRNYLFRFVDNPAYSNDALPLNTQIIKASRPSKKHDGYGIIGDSYQIRNIRNIIKKIAPSSASVLIEGPTGTGKELIAQAIHDNSGVSGQFVPINCGAIPPALLQSELFGYVEGAFTGARKGGNIGKFELADGGTIFLDEIGEMPLDMQVSLLRFLQDFTVTRVGDNHAKKIRVRIIAATNRNLTAEIESGKFREDLYYRLNVVKIDVPPLNERREDILLLAQYFLDELSRKYGSSLVGFDKESSDALMAYEWPGNVRQLINVLERVILFADKETIISKYLLPGHISKTDCEEDDNSDTKKGSFKDLKTLETNRILQVYNKSEGNITLAAKSLGIARSTLYRKLRRLGVIEKKEDDDGKELRTH